MSYKLRFFFSPVHELLLSFSLYKRQTQMKYLALGSGWPAEVEENIAASLKEKIASKNNLYFEDLSILLMIQAPEKDNIEGFFNWLQSKTSGEIYELLSPFLNEKNTLPPDLAIQRDRYITLLKKWKEQYFDKTDASVLKRLRSDMYKMNQLLEEKTSEEIVQKASRFIVTSKNVKEVYLIPGFHFYPMSLVDQFKDTLFITYPVRTKESDQEKLLRTTKAISDERRIKILRFLSNGVYTFTNIVSEIGMAKGNIHHHLSILRAAGLLNIHITDEPNTFYYSTNKDFTYELKIEMDAILNDR